MFISEGSTRTQYCFAACPPGARCTCRQQDDNQIYNQKIMTELEKVQGELIELQRNQIVDLTMMSKIELGDDVIQEIVRLQNKIKQLKNE